MRPLAAVKLRSICSGGNTCLLSALCRVRSLPGKGLAWAPERACQGLASWRGCRSHSQTAANRFSKALQLQGSQYWHALFAMLARAMRMLSRCACDRDAP